MMKKVASTLTRRHFAGDTGKIVKYTPCSRQDLHVDEDLDEIAVVSNADPGAVRYGSGLMTANGPRVVPGIITSRDRAARGVIGDRLSASGTRINMSSPVPVYPGKSTETIRGKSVSRQSLLDVVSTKLSGGVDGAGGGGGGTGGTGDGQNGGAGGAGGASSGSGVFGKKRFSRDTAGYVNRAHVSSELDLSGRKGLRDPTARRARELRSKFDKWETSTASSDRAGCKWTFVFDPSGRLCYYWSMVVSVAFLYNFWVLVYRFAFQEITPETLVAWFSLDYLADLLYVLDIVFHFRTGYLEDGVLQTDSIKLRQHYLNSTMFYVDCLCLLPLDFLYLSIGFNSALRCFRLIKIYRFWTFLDRTERHTNYPNVFRACSLIHYLLVIFHWNACLYHQVLVKGGFASPSWVYDDVEEEGEKTFVGSGGVVREYLHSFYWSTLSLTTIGDLPRPHTKAEYLFVIVELVFGLLLFATVLGHVANIVTNVSAARKEFQAKLDGVKTYMRTRRVPHQIQVKVIKWFDYLWMTQKSSDEEKSVGCLPDKLKAEIAIHVHLDTLKRVEIFQNTEAGFLCELVLRLRPVLFSPGDYICRKGEVGKEMYIVNRGRLQVVADNGKTVLATLKAGSYFGEISILNMGTAGNRRTASVRSVGYSDLFCLSKQDMWDVLKEYPAARVRLEAIAVKRLEKYKKAPLEKMPGQAVRGTGRQVFPLVKKYPQIPEVRDFALRKATDVLCVAMGRSQSTPGLVESKGRVPIEEMYVPPRSSSPAASSDRANLDSPLLSTTSSAGGNSTDDEKRNTFLSVGLLGAPLHPPLPPSTTQASFLHPLGVVGSRAAPLPPMPVGGGSVASYRTDSGSLEDRRSSIATSPSNLLSPVTSPQGFLPSSSTPNTLEASPATDFTAVSPGSAESSRAFGLAPPTTTAHPLAPPLLLPQPYSGGSTGHLPRDGATQEMLLAEIKRLRERLVTLETENASMSIKLSQQQWDMEHRLAEIEMQICGGSSLGSTGSVDDNERNRESII